MKDIKTKINNRLIRHGAEYTYDWLKDYVKEQRILNAKIYHAFDSNYSMDNYCINMIKEVTIEINKRELERLESEAFEHDDNLGNF